MTFSKVVKSVIIWILITPLLVIVIDSIGESASVNYLNGLIQLSIGYFLITFYKFPRNYIFVALFVPGFSNLYFLIYGNLKKNRETEQIKNNG